MALASGAALRQAKDVEFTFHGFVTFGSEIGGSCGLGMNQVDLELSIKSATIVDAATGLAIAGFSFHLNEVTGGDFSKLSGEPFVGFLSSVGETIPSGVAVDLRFEATVPADTSFDDIAAALEGGSPLIGSGEATADGVLTGGHLEFRDAGDIMEDDGGGSICLDFTDFCDALELDVAGGGISGTWENYDCAGASVAVEGVIKPGLIPNACGANGNAVVDCSAAGNACTVGGLEYWFSLDSLSGSMDMNQGNPLLPGGSCWISGLTYTTSMGPCSFGLKEGLPPTSSASNF